MQIYEMCLLLLLKLSNISIKKSGWILEGFLNSLSDYYSF